MARKIQKLSAQKVARETKPGRHSDGGGLYLVVDALKPKPDGSAPGPTEKPARRWVFLFRRNGRLREMGLGGFNSIPLATARELAADCRKTVALGGDPIAARKRMASAVPTFGDFADKFIQDKGPGWRNDKHRAQWTMTLETYAAPLRRMPVDTITTEDVLTVLRPIWTTKAETASRLRGRLEQVLDAARVAGHRTEENPARWRGHLDKLLAKRDKKSRGHHAAMPYDDVPAFVRSLREQEGFGPLALEFTILTAARSNEALGMRWAEIDTEKKVWTVPADRMKAGLKHQVPLAPRALEILAEAAKFRIGEFVFPGRKPNRPLSNMVFLMLLRRMGRDLTAHGFRSSFRDWAGDKTTFPREVAEAALAHAIGDETEQAYRRSDALEKRRKLMDAWARFCTSGVANGVVVPLRSA